MIEKSNSKEVASKGSEVEKVMKESKHYLSKLTGEIKEWAKETKEASWKAVQDRFDRISNRIMEVWQVGWQFAELEYVNKSWERVLVRTQITDAPLLHISVIRKDWTSTAYELYPTTYHIDGWYTLTAGDELWWMETMKNLSIDQVMQSLDKFENRLKEYETEQFDRMQQYAQNDSEDADKVLDSLA